MRPGVSQVALALGFFALAYPAGSLSDRMSPRTILMCGMGVLVAANLLLAQDFGFAGLVLGILLWGAHMALTQGIFARMIADSSEDSVASAKRNPVAVPFSSVCGVVSIIKSTRPPVARAIGGVP